jgi:HEAT repeats
MKSKLSLCLALLASGGLVGGSNAARANETVTNAEPRYLDKSLSEWIPLARVRGEVALVPLDRRAPSAVRQIGTNAIPWLLQWLRSDQAETAQLGIEGFALLGPSAKLAMPELLEMASDWRISAAPNNAALALASLYETNGVHYAFPYLVPLATNQSAPAAVRARTVAAIAEKILLNDSAVPVFLQCLLDTDSRVASAAAHGLNRSYGHVDPKPVVPALAACLSSHTNGPEDVAVRMSAASALDDFASLIHYPSSRPKSELDDLRQAMSSAVPALVKALNDEDWRVARDAAMALGNAAIEPEVVVPALVKSLDYPHPDRYGDVRREAINALGNFGEAAQSAVPALTKIAQSDPWGYVGGGFAASALKKIIAHKR